MYRIAARSNAGRKMINEDSYFICRFELNGIYGLVAAVADGVSALNVGDVASRVAVATFTARVVERLFAGASLIYDDIFIAEILRDAVNYANSVVLDSVVGGGTTLTGVVILDDNACAVNVGDSRLYLFGDGEIHQITRDHSVAWSELEKEMHRLAAMDFKERAVHKRKIIVEHPQAHTITNLVGYYGRVEPIDLFKLRLYEGDGLLLTTDGVTDVLNDYEIWQIITEEGDENKIVDRLVAYSMEKGSIDNITALIIKKKNSSDRGLL
jgi:protein phosphatase